MKHLDKIKGLQGVVCGLDSRALYIVLYVLLTSSGGAEGRVVLYLANSPGWPRSGGFCF